MSNREAGTLTPDVIFVIPEERLDQYLGVGFLAAALAERNVRSVTIQGSVEEIKSALWELLRRRPAPLLVGIACLYVFSDRPLLHLAQTIKSWSPTTKIVVGGHSATFDWLRLMRNIPEIDFIVRGEGDFSLPALYAALREGTSPALVRGIALRQEDRTPFETPACPPVSNLDALPFPARDTLRQVIDLRGGPEGVLARVLGSRGCYANCRFCSMVSFYSLDGHQMRWRPRTPESIVGEVALVKREYGTRTFWFADDEFVGPPPVGVPRLRRLAALLKPLEIEFGFDTRSSGIVAVPAGDLRLLRQAGLRIVSLGFESGSQAALDRMNKGLAVEHNWNAVRHLRAAGIDYRFGFVMYDRDTSPADLKANFKFLRFAGPHRICNTGSFRLLNAEFPEVGSPLHRRLALVGHRVGLATAPDLPRLDEDELGYRFADPRIRIFRSIMRRMAFESVEPAMLPRRFDASGDGSNLWFGVNSQPQNVAAMQAFLSCHEWLAEHIDDERLDSEQTYLDLREHFAREFAAAQVK